LSIVTGAASDRGRVRPNNEDSYAILVPPRLVEGLHALFIVADGLGGHQAGEVASRMIVDRFAEAFGRFSDRTQPAARIDWREELGRVILAANDQVYRAAEADPNLLGMGSTVVAGVIEDDRLHLGNVGDSRAYLINDATIFQLSQDHSWVADQVRAGTISPSDARHHPWKNRLTRAVGSTPDVTPDTWTIELVDDDRILLCTDGLTNLVTDDELADVVRSNAPDVAATHLVDLAIQRGAPDNVTVVIVQFQDEPQNV
jgi:serine/threonine protein phosphatase PrpC